MHQTDTVSVIVSCSEAPVAVDVNGITRLSNALGRVKEMLSKLAIDCIDSGNVDLVIPELMCITYAIEYRARCRCAIIIERAILFMVPYNPLYFLALDK